MLTAPPNSRPEFADEHATSSPAGRRCSADSLVTITHVVYALHTLSLVIGAFGARRASSARSCSAGRRSSR